MRKRLRLMRFVDSRTRPTKDCQMSVTAWSKKLRERSLESRQKIRHLRMRVQNVSSRLVPSKRYSALL